MTERLRALLRRCQALPLAVRLALPLACMGLLWWSSSRTPPDRALTGFRQLAHNAAHVLAWMVLGALWFVAVGGGGRRRRVAVAFTLAAAYGIVDEVHQSYVPGRVASVADACSDALGAALACCALAWFAAADRRLGGWLPWLGVGAAASVAAATWLPW